MHFVMTKDYFKSAPAKTVPCGNQFEVCGIGPASLSSSVYVDLSPLPDDNAGIG